MGRIIAKRYRLEDVLGEGGQATVHRAIDLHTGREVAVKVLNGQLARDPTVVARVAREQQAMVMLAGTNAVEFIDLCVEADETLCLVLELLEGRDLESRLAELHRAGEQMPIQEMVEIMQPVVDTLDRAHAVGIVHRDLKPSNIFLLSARLGGGTRLLDFGLANLATSDPLTAVGTVMGSPSYIAPESWAGIPGRAGSRADLYSLGVILFRLLSGRMPFVGKTLLEKMRNTTSAERPSLYELRPDLPPQVDIWVERALAVDPKDRFASPAACFGELLWALELAPHPSEQKRNQLSAAQASEVRNWLDDDAAKRDSLPLLSIEPMPIAAQGEFDDAEEVPASDRLPYLSVDPEPVSEPPLDASQERPVARCLTTARLPPIPKPPAVPGKEVSATFAQRDVPSSVAPSAFPEKSGLRTSDEWEAETAFYLPGNGLPRR